MSDLLPANLEALIEPIAEQIHQRWMTTRRSQGWKYGSSRNDERKEHPSLIPYSDLTEEEKEVDRQTARQTIESLHQLGYHISKPP